MIACGQARFITHAGHHQQRVITQLSAWYITHDSNQKTFLRQALTAPLTRARVLTSFLFNSQCL
jgi:hypothetical protein